MLLYVGPDQIIPLSGFLGTLIGLGLMFWGKLLEGARRVARIFSTKTTSQS